MTQLLKTFLFISALTAVSAQAEEFDLSANTDDAQAWQLGEEQGLDSALSSENTEFRPPHRGRPDWRRPPHRRPDWRRPDWRRPDWRRGVACYARDAFGRTYSARGWNSRSFVQRQAVRACHSYSRAPRSCRPIGCR